jgi:hypothetical protein
MNFIGLRPSSRREAVNCSGIDIVSLNNLRRDVKGRRSELAVECPGISNVRELFSFNENLITSSHRTHVWPYVCYDGLIIVAILEIVCVIPVNSIERDGKSNPLGNVGHRRAATD